MVPKGRKQKKLGGPLVFENSFGSVRCFAVVPRSKNIYIKTIHKILSGGPLGFGISCGSVLCIPVVPRGKKYNLTKFSRGGPLGS